VLLGETGVGKSTFGNRLFGRKPGMCATNNSLIDQNNATFGVGNAWTSHTNETAWIAGPWLGDYTNPSCFTIVDTPGIGDSEGRDCVHGMVIAEEVKRLSPIDAFVLIFKGTNTRFTTDLQEQLSFYEELFGQEFWKRVIIEVSFWRHRNSDKDDRLEDRETDEGKFTHDLNFELRKKFNLQFDIPVVFVDPKYSEKRGRRYPEERDAFQKNTTTLWKFVNSGQSYTCHGHCRSTGFLEGKPTLISEAQINARIGDKVVLDFSIWFSKCPAANLTGSRSYDIFKDGVKIWTVVDEQGEEKTRFKPKQMIKNVNTPLNMEIFDRCSQTMGSQSSRQELCNVELSKFKIVQVLFGQLTEVAFGSYYVVNAEGKSAEVLIKEMVDGSYSGWTEWGPWDTVKQAKERTRVCTPPVNGGAPCESLGPAVEECDSDECAEPSKYGPWGDWRCQEACYNPNKNDETREVRERNCTDANPRHPTQNCELFGTWETTGKPCSGKTAVPMCPQMTEIITKPCSGSYDGTDDNIQLEFRNAYPSIPRETCMTDYLDDPEGDEFEFDTIDRWGGDLLMSCFGHRFRPISGLDFRFHSNTWGWNLHTDELTLCEVTVQFGTRGSPGYSKWYWSGRSTNIEPYPGYYNSYGAWQTMRKIQG